MIQFTTIYLRIEIIHSWFPVPDVSVNIPGKLHGSLIIQRIFVPNLGKDVLSDLLNHLHLLSQNHGQKALTCLTSS